MIDSENYTATPDVSLLGRVSAKDVPSLKRVHLETFRNGEKVLHYIGTHHSHDTDNKSHEVIQQALLKHKPKFLVLEGFETQRGLSPHLGFNFKNPKHQMDFLKSEEPIHTAEVARKFKIPFIGGEPSGKAIFSALEEQGYSTKEVMALHLVRVIAQWKRQGRLKNVKDLPKMADYYLSDHPVFETIPKQDRLNFDEFKVIYDSHKAELGNRDILQLTASDSNSRAVPTNYFQKMSNIMDRTRDEHLVSVIAQALDKYDDVMVVYGNSHQVVSRPVFEKMFASKPTIETLVLSEVTPSVAEKSKPSLRSKILEYAAVGCVAAGLTALALGASALLIGSLIVGGVVAYGTGVILEPKTKTEAETPAIIRSKDTSTIAPHSPTLSRADGKSWAISTAQHSEHVSKSI